MLRSAIPKRIRLIVEMAIISVLVIVVDQLLRAYWWPMSMRLGPYVGLIITNCIVMGRAEAYRPAEPAAALDGGRHGQRPGLRGRAGHHRRCSASCWAPARYWATRCSAKSWYTPNQIMVLAPGAFFALGFLIAGYNVLRKPQEDEEAKP